MRDGAYDFLVKPFSSDRLTVTLNNALERRALKQIVVDMTPKRHGAFAGFVGSSMVMQDVYRLIERAAPSTASVFVTGESGTGKELCAEAIHTLSPRSQGPIWSRSTVQRSPMTCWRARSSGTSKAPLPEPCRPVLGAAAQADGGTLFLDEICDMAPDLQAKLLRFVQSGVFQPVGSSEPQKVNVRFVCATNRDPLAEIDAGRFRADLLLPACTSFPSTCRRCVSATTMWSRFPSSSCSRLRTTKARRSTDSTRQPGILFRFL